MPTENPEQVLRVGSIVLDPARYSVTAAGQPIPVARREFLLLKCLMSNAGQVVPTAELYQQVWGYQDDPALDVLLRSKVLMLRKNLVVIGHQPEQVLQLVDGGVLLQVDPGPEASQRQPPET